MGNSPRSFVVDSNNIPRRIGSLSLGDHKKGQHNEAPNYPKLSIVHPSILQSQGSVVR